MPDDDGTPAEPLTGLAEGAAAMHELFMAYVGAGFTRPEAMQIILTILASKLAGHS